jgi:hypothetical protein
MPSEKRFPIVGLPEGHHRAKRDDTVTFRVSEQHSAWLRDRARAVGVTRSALCMSVILDYLGGQTEKRAHGNANVHIDRIARDVERAIQYLDNARALIRRTA